ncbi:MAG: RecX family transcriptional regulator [Bacteroidales bacterium]|nr:RecX family transcriptional regulator [Bacteroidales bacterium]
MAGKSIAPAPAGSPQCPPQDLLKRRLSRMQGLCARREYCSADIRRKLLLDRSNPLTSEQAEKVLEALRKEKYLDDARYAGAFARDKSSLSGWGATKIRYALRAKGIADEDIASALERIDGEKSDEKLRSLLSARARTLSADPHARQKLLRYGLSRGYDYDTISEVLASLLQ